MADIRCPMCGRSNPDDLETCQFCDARLKPLTGTKPDDPGHINPGEKPIKRQTSEFEKAKLGNNRPIHAGEQPTRKDTGELERALPSWLKSLRGIEDEPPVEIPAETPAEASPDLNLPAETQEKSPDGSSDEMLDWLSGLGSVSADEEEDVPEWMAGLRLPTASETELETTIPSEPIQAPPEKDWKSGLDSGSGQVSSALPEQGDDSVSDWLSRLTPESDSPPPAGAGAFEAPPAAEPFGAPTDEIFPAENTPDWLDALKSKTAVPEESTPSLGDTTPHWLKDIKSQAAAQEEPTADTEEDVPDWLSRLPAIPAVTHDAEGPGIEPDWLNKLKDEGVEPEVTPSKQDSGAATPDWLNKLDAETGAAASVFTSEPIPAGEPSAEVPDWLSQLKSDVSQASDAEKHADEFETAAEPYAAEKQGETIPDWLSGVDQTAGPSAGTPALVMPDAGESSSEPGSAAFSLETPDWLSKLRPERAERPEKETGRTISSQEDSGSENLEAADLPSWVQAMRPVEAVISETLPSDIDETSMAEASGPLAGLRGVLPAAPGPGMKRKPPAYALKLQVNNNQQRYAAQLEKMIMDEGLAREIKPARKISNKLWRLVISIVLIVAVLLPLISGKQMAPDMVLYPSEWEATSILLDQFRSDAPLLLVFDYDPALSGELEAAAAPVIDHILYRGNRLALISTAPTGPALAEQFLESTQKYHLDTGLLYTDLGYLAGGPAGIQLFATDPVSAVTLDVDGVPAWETSSLQGVTRLSEFSALILLTDNADTGRIWIEQTRAAIGDTPFLMIISAQAEPMIRPYFDSGQIQGLVTGLVGGKTYEQTYGVPGLARRYWDSFGLGTLAATILIAAGSVWGAFMFWRTRRKA
jgi:hypothetical protein